MATSARRRRLRSIVALAALGIACVSKVAFGAEPPAEEVVVTGARPSPAGTVLRAEEVRTVAGAFGDPGRIIESMPGISPVASLIPFYFVRGATPSDTGYWVDGIRVPFVSHAPPGGSFLPASAIDRVEFYPSAAPARYGGAAGAVLAITTLPPANRFRGEGALRLYDAAVLAESPIDETKTFLASGRYGYPKLALALVGSDANSHYWDYLSRASWKVSNRQRLSVVSLGSRDLADDGTTTLFDQQFHRAELRYDLSTRGGAATRIAALVGHGNTGGLAGSVGHQLIQLRAESSVRASSALAFSAGSAVQWDRYDVSVSGRYRQLDPSILFGPRTDVTLSAYADAAYRLSPSVEVDAGARAAAYTSRRDRYAIGSLEALNGLHALDIAPPPTGATARVGVEPRLSLRARLTSRIAWLSTVGVAQQPPSFLLPGLAMSRLEDGLQKSFQLSQGVELRIPGKMTLKAVSFLHRYLDLSDPSASCPNDWGLVYNPVDACFARRVKGRAFGAELLLRRSLSERLSGWVSYTLSRSTRTAHAPGDSIVGASREAIPEVLSEWDRTHVLSVIAGYDFGRGWRVGARFFYETGRPYSRTVMGVLVPPYNRERLPSFHRVDVRLEKKWTFSETASVSLVFEGFNVTLQREATDCVPSRTNIQNRPVLPAMTEGPLDRCQITWTPPSAFPSVGVDARF